MCDSFGLVGDSSKNETKIFRLSSQNMVGIPGKQNGRYKGFLKRMGNGVGRETSEWELPQCSSQTERSDAGTSIY